MLWEKPFWEKHRGTYNRMYMIDTPGFDLLTVFQALYDVLVMGSERAAGINLTVFLVDLWAIIALISTIITPVLLLGIAYIVFRYRGLRAQELAAYRARAVSVSATALVPKNEQWKRVEELATSERPSDWRVAILEADVMLDTMVTGMGYLGDNLGGRLRAIDKSDLRSLDQAWEAHKVRNQIAHGGGDFILTQREARRVIELYRVVFTETNYI